MSSMNFTGRRLTVLAYLVYCANRNHKPASVRARTLLSVWWKSDIKRRRRSLSGTVVSASVGGVWSFSRRRESLLTDRGGFGVWSGADVFGEGEDFFYFLARDLSFVFLNKEHIFFFPWRIIPELWCCPRIMKETLNMKFAWKTKMVKTT